MAQNEKQKTVDIDGVKYQLRRMSPVKGSYIWQRIMGGVLKAQAAIGGSQSPDAEPAESAAEQSPVEQRLKTTYAFASMHIDFADHEFIQREALTVVARMENLAGVEAPMPVVNGSGTVVIPELADNPMLVSKVVLESLAFNLSCFLD
jgi:hypothetical protein